ncbi:hypothetical protein BH10PSE2_BH10PSE2_22420 [soil metagenome]
MTYPEPYNSTPGRHPLLDRLSQPRSLMVVAGVVVLAGVAAATFAFGRGDHRAGPAGGAQMQLALVAPVEPTVQPGERMEVGALSDGFDGKMPPPPPREDEPWMDQPAYVETGWGSDGNADDPESRRIMRSQPPMDPKGYNQGRYDQGRDPDDAPGTPPLTQGSPRGDALGLGFDGDRPNYEAQRAARRAALDSRIEDERRDPRRIYSSAGPQNDPDAEFY